MQRVLWDGMYEEQENCYQPGMHHSLVDQVPYSCPLPDIVVVVGPGGMECQLGLSCSENVPRTGGRENFRWDSPASGLWPFRQRDVGRTGRSHIPFLEGS